MKLDKRYWDTKLSFKERAAILVGNMTLDEKIAQMLWRSPAIPRLGVPAYTWWSECLHGVGRSGLATVFPQSIGRAATFDVALEKRVATVISVEGRAKCSPHTSDHQLDAAAFERLPPRGVALAPGFGLGLAVPQSCSSRP